MTTILDDPRVTARGNGGFTVVHGGETYTLLHNNMYGWTVYRGPDMALPTLGGVLASGYSSAESAVEAVLAEPA